MPLQNHKEVEKKIMSIVAEDGSIEEVEVILAFEFKDTKKEYVIYTKNEKDENENITVKDIEIPDGKTIIEVTNELDKSKSLASVGGVEYITDIIKKLPNDFVNIEEVMDV